MRSITKKCRYNRSDRIQIEKNNNGVKITIKGGANYTCLTTASTRELFWAGLQMCDELEAKK